MSKAEICQCELSGDIHVIVDGQGCELCEPSGRQPLTGTNVQAALTFLNDRVNALNNLFNVVEAKLFVKDHRGALALMKLAKEKMK